MNVVVADTSPINYLVLIGNIGVLRILYTRVVIPVEVFNELTAAGSPEDVAAWANGRPDWLEIKSALPDFEPPLDELDARERAAIRLALAEAGVLLLIDEAAGRSAASKL